MPDSVLHLRAGDNCRADLSAQIERWGLRDAGFAYNIVAVFGSQSTGKSQFLCRHSAEKEREVPGGNCPVGNGTHLCPQRSTIIATLSLFVDDSRPPESLYSNAGWKDDIRWSNRLRLKESRVFPNKTKEVERRKSPHRVFNAISEKTTRVLYTPPHAAGQLTCARGPVVCTLCLFNSDMKALGSVGTCRQEIGDGIAGVDKR